MAKPNIIFFMTDQHRFDCIGLHNAAIKTPHLDSIFKDGILFSDAVCNVPMCVPSRYSMMTGLYGNQHGVHHNCQIIPRDELLPQSPLPEILQQGGYQTVGIGKTHWYMGDIKNRMSEPVVPSTRGFDIRRGQYSHNDPNSEKPYSYIMEEDMPEGWEMRDKERVELLNGHPEESIEGYTGKVASIPEEYQRETWLTKQALKIIDEELDSSKPLFFYFSLDYPHAFFSVPERFEKMYSIDTIPDMATPPEGMKLFEHFPNMEHVQRMVDYWKDLKPLERRQCLLRYYALCSYVDECIGEVFNKLAEKGINKDNSLFLFTSDHGDSMGERYRFSKYSLYEGAVRVPLMVTGVGVKEERKGTVTRTPASLVDIVPTLTAIAGLPGNPHLPGKNLLSSQQFSKGSFAELHGHSFDFDFQTIAPCYMWRTQKWKLIISMPGTVSDYSLIPLESKGELYDLEKDPHEFNNLYDNAEYLPVRDQLKSELLEHIMISFAKYPFAMSLGSLEKPAGKEGDPSSYYRNGTVV